MRKLAVVLCVVLAALSSISAQKLDVAKKPDPLPVKDFVFPKYSEHTLKNGLKVYVLEDHEQPTVNIEMNIIGGELIDNAKTGVAKMVADMLLKGTKSRSALQLANELDGVAASISASTQSGTFTIQADALKKHLNILLPILGDVILNPSFPQEEFDKMIPQILASIKNAKSNAESMAQAMSRKTIYGYDHIYSRERTEESVQSITVGDLKQYHNIAMKPGSAALAVVGDVTANEIIPQLENLFSNWPSGKAPAVNVAPPAPMEHGVYFIERPGSVQSSIIAAAAGVAYKHPDFLAQRICANLLGAGFGGRLNKTLRETYSYTYSPGAFMSSAKHMNRFVCYANVRNSVTDSALEVTLEEISKLRDETVSNEELSAMKRYVVGNYFMQYDKPEFIASQLLSTLYNEITVNELKSVPQKIMNITSQQVQAAAKKYLTSEKINIIVVGSRDVLPKLQKFGKVFEYTLDLEPVDSKKNMLENAGITTEELLKKHRSALGGEALQAVNTIVSVGEAQLTMGGGTAAQKLKGKLIQKQKMPNKEFSELDFGMFKQRNWVNGLKAWKDNPREGVSESTGEELQEALADAAMFKSARLLELGYTVKILGKKDGNIIAEAKRSGGEAEKYYFDENTMLVVQMDRLADSPQGKIPVIFRYKNYTATNGAMLPQTLEQENGPISIVVTFTHSINESIDDKIFTPAN